MKSEIKRNNKGRGGRGVYAAQKINMGEIIEESHCIVFPLYEIKEGRLGFYVFEWSLPNDEMPEETEFYALALGNGSLYNHSYSPNADYETQSPDKIIFSAIKEIEKGEEITINYNGDVNDMTPVDFGGN